MLFTQHLKEFVKGKKNADKTRGYPNAIKIDNLKNKKCSDRISKKHLKTKELVVVSHPGWERYEKEFLFRDSDYLDLLNGIDENLNLSKRRKIKLDRLFYLQENKLSFLRDELMLEELISFYCKKNIPIVVTIPSYQHFELSNPDLNETFYLENMMKKKDIDYFDKIMKELDSYNKIIAHKKKFTYYSNFLDSILKNHNVYLLPTNGGSGTILGDISGTGDILLQKVEERVKKFISIDVENGKLKMKVNNEPTGNRLLDINFDIISLARNSLHKEEYKKMTTIFGIKNVEDVRNLFWKTCEKEVKNQMRLISQEPLVSPLLENLVCNDWDNIYFAGGYIEKCLSGIMSYFTLSDVSKLTLLEKYSIPEINNDSQIPNQFKNEISDLLVENIKNSKKSKSLNSKILEIIKENGNGRNSNESIEILKGSFEKYKKFYNSDSNMSLKIDVNYLI